MGFGMSQAYRSNRGRQSYNDVLDGVLTCRKISKLKFGPYLLYDAPWAELMKVKYLL